MKASGQLNVPLLYQSGISPCTDWWKGECPPISYLDTWVKRNIFVPAGKQTAILRPSISYRTHYADWAILAPKLYISSRKLQLDWCGTSILCIILSSVAVAIQNWNVLRSVRPDSKITETSGIMWCARITVQRSDLMLRVLDRFKID